MNLKKTLAMITGLLLLVVAVFCATELYDHETLSGMVLCRENIAIPDGCRLVVVLSEEKDGGRRPVASVSRNLEGEQVPFPFELFYRGKSISDGGVYSLSARIEDEVGEVLFFSEKPIPMPKDGESADILLTSTR